MFRHTFRDARRLLTRDRGLTLVVLLTLTLGIGANTVVFSLLYGVLLRPLPYPEPDRLVRIFEKHPEFPKFPVSPANFLDYRRDTHAFAQIAVYTRGDLQLSDGASRPERLAGLSVSPEYFRVLGVTPVWGRLFREDEMRQRDSRVLIISDGLWRRRFNSDPRIVGQSIRIDSEAWTVVGILPPGFQHVGGSYRSQAHGETVDAWWPTYIDPKDPPRGAHYLNAVGRLKPGVTPQDATQDLDRIAARNDATFPGSNKDWRTRITPLGEEIVGGANTLIVMLMAAAGAVLLIGCANVASLLLARALVRRREMAIRLALGASASRLITQVLAESLLLSILGGLCGFAAAIIGTHLLTAVMPQDFPRLHMIHLDWRVLGFTALLACATAIVFGLVPALHSARTNVQGLMRDGGGRGASAGRHTLKLRHGLVVAEIMLASALLVAAGLLARSFVTLLATSPGFHAERVLTFTIALPQASYPKMPDSIALHTRLLERLSALPGVERAGLTSALPWTGWDENTSFAIVNDRVVRDGDPHARFNAVSPDYFETIGVPLVRGRFANARDTLDAPSVVVINDALARTYFAGDIPIGRVLDLWGKKREIIGIVGDVKDAPADAAAVPALYMPTTQQVFPSMTLTLKTAGDPLTLVNASRAAVQSLDAELPIAEVRALDDVTTAAYGERRFMLALVGLFGALALTLSAIGAYGVMSYAAAQRQREFGVRLALGADASQILRLVLTQGLRLTTIGLALGLALALALGQLMRSLLYGISPTDTTTFLLVATLTLIVALAASLLPARRAARADPMRALRID